MPARPGAGHQAKSADSRSDSRPVCNDRASLGRLLRDGWTAEQATGASSSQASKTGALAASKSVGTITKLRQSIRSPQLVPRDQARTGPLRRSAGRGRRDPRARAPWWTPGRGRPTGREARGGGPRSRPAANRTRGISAANAKLARTHDILGYPALRFFPVFLPSMFARRIAFRCETPGLLKHRSPFVPGLLT